jgi:hypothetical protein
MALSPEAERLAHHTRLAADPLAVLITRSPGITDEEFAEAIRLRVRDWSAAHAHYFDAGVADRAAALIVGDRLHPLTHTVAVRRDHLLAYLHLAARY